MGEDVVGDLRLSTSGLALSGVCGARCRFSLTGGASDFICELVVLAANLVIEMDVATAGIAVVLVLLLLVVVVAIDVF